MADADTIRLIESIDDRDLRGLPFELAGEGNDPGPPYKHQSVGLDRMERGGAYRPPVSGILHYPTGAGKTRVAMQFIARALGQNPRHRFIWATHTKNLLRQSMVRMTELSALFPRATRFAWKDAVDMNDGDAGFHVVFMTRNQLTKALGQAGDGRCVNHAWSSHLLGGNPLTLIYDECHQLGAEELQRAMRKFYDSGIPGHSKGAWRVIGLSATPVPTRPESHTLLQEHVFPLRREAPTTSHTWPFQVIQKMSNDALIRQGVLCPINLYIDRQGTFDLPADLLKRVIGEARLRELGRNARADDVQRYALQFNRAVMASPEVVSFLSNRLGESARLLGKTIVFASNIEAANRMAGLLYETFPALRGKVAAVHSKMSELRVPGQDDANAHEVLARFRRLRDEPSILVNVDMLTEGFDDPKVHTVVLARLTLSTNRFWQMIGRGTRGKAAKGTNDCNVVDPVKLTRLYDYFAGYQPNFSRNEEVEFEDPEEKGGDDLASPVVPQVVRPPDPATGVYTVDPELERVHLQVAQALRHFLSGMPLSESQVVEVSRRAHVRLSVGQVTLVPSSGDFDPTTATAMLLGEVSNLEQRTGVDLAWFRQQQIPIELTESLLKHHLRMLRAIETMCLWTDTAFAEAQMRGDFLAAMEREASGTSVVMQSVASAPKAVAAAQDHAWGAAEEAVLDAALAVAGADGRVDDVEVSAIGETLRRMYGRAPTPEAYVEGVLGANLARADVTASTPAPAPSINCPACGSETPTAGAWCTSCGALLRKEIV